MGAIVLALLALICVQPSAAIDIATGSMLGPSYKQTSFYTRTSPGSRWELTYSGLQYRGKARGRMFVLRVTQGVFDDEWLTEHDYDPDTNTQRLVDALDTYKAHGIMAFSVGLQATDPGYDPQVNGIARRNGAKYGPKRGLLASAFKPDGSLKPEWLARLERVIREANRRAMVVNLIYFTHGQDEVLESPQAIAAAAANITDWLIENNFRNVVIDIANEWDLEGDTWDHGSFITENIVGLVEFVRDRFNGADFLLPIGASSSSRMAYPESLARLCDLVLVHGNGRSLSDKTSTVRQLKDYDRLVWMTADDSGLKMTPENLQAESASADALFKEAAGWGYVPRALTQQFPFAYQPGETAEFTDGMSTDQLRATYFKAVLEHIAGLVLRKPPRTTGKKKRR